MTPKNDNVEGSTLSMTNVKSDKKIDGNNQKNTLKIIFAVFDDNPQTLSLSLHTFFWPRKIYIVKWTFFLRQSGTAIYD
jgi:hypothetical protein